MDVCIYIYIYNTVFILKKKKRFKIFLIASFLHMPFL